MTTPKLILDCYTRVSTAEQKKTGNSLVVQREMGKKVAKKLGFKFRHRDEGARSSTIHYREVLEQLKEDIEQGLVKNIWCQDRSRMFRDMTDGLLFRRDYLEKYGISLYEGEAPNKIDFDNEDESVIYDIITRIAQSENKRRIERSQRGKIQKLKEAVASNKSVYMGGTATYGYMNENKQWKVNKEEEKWVKWMFNAYEKGQSLKDIKNHLDKEGVKTRRTSSGLWNMTTIFKMLNNKTYTGIHTVYIKKIERQFSFKVGKIITVSQFNSVQRKLERNNLMKDRNKKHASLLGDFLECECGTNIGSEVKQLTKKDGTKINTRRYYCMNKNYQWRDGVDRDCSNNKSLDMDRTDVAIMERVRKVVSDSHTLREKTKQEVLDRKQQIEENIVRERLALEDKCQRIQSSIDNIENQIVDMEVDIGLGKKDKSIANKVIQRYSDELQVQHEEYKLVEQQLDELNENLVWVDWVDKFAAQINTSSKSQSKKKEFLQGLLSKIVVHSEMGVNRSEKEVQVGHSFDIKFKIKIVNDKIIWNDEGDKRKGYNLKDGRNLYKTKLVEEVTAKAGRVYPKKKH